jgi:PAS domain-containing protein
MLNRHIISFAIVACLSIGGVAALAGSPEGIAGCLHRWSTAEMSGFALLGLAAGCGLLALLGHHRSARALVLQLRSATTEVNLTRVERGSGLLVPVADALNELLDSAETTVYRSRLSVKELEIQLKVATAERKHAEAIIYSISDAVLVTDPFDELVLANESAALTFDFELRGASRSPVQNVLRDQKMIELIREMRQSNSRTGRRIVEHQVRTPLGERIFKVTLSCVADQASAPVLRDGKPLPERGEHGAGVVAVLHDMTRE